MRPLGGGVDTSETVSAPQAPLQLLTPGDLPAPAAAMQLLAEHGISGIRQSWQAPSPSPYPRQSPATSARLNHAPYSSPDQDHQWNARQYTGDQGTVREGSRDQVTPVGVDMLQPLGAGAREVYSQMRPLQLLAPSPFPMEGGNGAPTATTHAASQMQADDVAMGGPLDMHRRSRNGCAGASGGDRSTPRPQAIPAAWRMRRGLNQNRKLSSVAMQVRTKCSVQVNATGPYHTIRKNSVYRPGHVWSHGTFVRKFVVAVFI